MYFQLLEIVLWSRRQGLAPRRVKFEPGCVNVISGASRTGKSAVIPIIDYCLGAGTCSIPVNTIRNACAWFGVIVRSSSGDMLLARREPGDQRSTDDMFIIQAPRIEGVPETVHKNISAEAVKRTLDELSGLTMLDTTPSGDVSGFQGRPSFRDMAAFMFQPQNVVANPDVLFYKTSSFEHREKLRKIFPYVLGAITADLLAKQHELRRIQADLRRKQRELSEIENVSGRWTAELQARISEARELGLIQVPNTWVPTRDAMLRLLRELAQRPLVTPAVSNETISDALKELSDLEEEERRTSLELTTQRRRLSEMQRMQATVSAYAETRRLQRERLQISSWLTTHQTSDRTCPVCGGAMEAAEALLAELEEALRAFEAEAGVDSEVPAAFDRELNRVRASVDETAEVLRGIQIRKNALVQRSESARGQQFQVRRAERFVGNLENALELHDRLGQDADLRAEVEALVDRERRLLSELRAENVEQRLRRALDQVNLLAGRLLPGLDAEYPDAPISLEIDDLTVRVSRTDREDLLSEIGSGSNWLSYHIATLLALHQFFISQRHSPVPSLLVMDQPSQVYFPKRAVVREDDLSEDPEFLDEDVEAVRKAFLTLAGAAGAVAGKLQVIVLDHASRDVWGDIDGVHEVEEWRGGLKLVPEEWLQ